MLQTASLRLDQNHRNLNDSQQPGYRRCAAEVKRHIKTDAVALNDQQSFPATRQRFLFNAWWAARRPQLLFMLQRIA
jgi:hypothetical protein